MFASFFKLCTSCTILIIIIIIIIHSVGCLGSSRGVDVSDANAEPDRCNTTTRCHVSHGQTRPEWNQTGWHIINDILLSLFAYAHMHYCWTITWKKPRVGLGHPSSPLSIYFLIFSPFHFFLYFIGFTYFLLLSIPSLSTRIVPLRFQAGGRRRRPNLVLVCFLFCTLCYLYSLVNMYCGALFCFVCSFSALTLLVGSFDP